MTKVCLTSIFRQQSKTYNLFPTRPHSLGRLHDLKIFCIACSYSLFFTDSRFAHLAMPRVYPPIEGRQTNSTLSPSLVESFAGFSAGIVSTLAVHPFDVIKTRLQGWCIYACFPMPIAYLLL